MRPWAVALSLLVMAAPAFANDILDLRWDDCSLSPGAVADYDFSCGTLEGQEVLFCGFQLDQPLDQVLGVIAVVDAISAAPALPNWWHLAAIGDCRSGNLLASADFAGYADCLDPWRGAASALIQGFVITEPRGASNTFRMKVVAGVLPDSARTLVANQMYYGVKIIIRNEFTAGPITCAGCTTPACLVLNSIEVVRISGAAGGNRVVTGAVAGGNWAQWNSGVGADCMAVPVRRTTWGRIKGLYR